MKEMKIFENEEFGTIRTIEIDGEPYFVGKDVAEALGYTDAFGALKKHVPDEDKQNCQNDSFNSPRGMVDLVDEDKKLKRTLYVSGQNREVRFLSKE